jgi:hypothetical protein
MHVSLEPEEAMKVEGTPLVRLYRPIVLADTAEHRLLPDPHVVFKKHGHLSVEEDSRTDRV